MTFTEKTIKKAMKGGWDLYDDVDVHMDGDIYVSIKGTDMLEYIDSEVIFLDPNFWECLGKAMGWEGKFICCVCEGNWTKEQGCENDANHPGQEIWIYKWHEFIDHLANRGIAEEFFKELK